MRVLRVDFARPPRWPAVVLWMGAVALLAAAGWMTWRDARDWQVLSAQRAATHALQARLDEASAKRAAFAASAVEPPPFAADARRWLALAKVDGVGVLRTVESAQLAGAKLIAVDVNSERAQAELEVEVASAEVAAAYLAALNAGDDTPAWTLIRLQTQGAIETALIRGQLR